MVWLDGKPILLEALAWPVDDPDLKSQDRKRQGWSVLDDQILFWRAFPSSENPRTVIYMANTTSARDTQADTIILERVAELDYAAHRLAIIPDIGFVTVEWRSNSGVVFQAHSRTGEFLRERHCPAQASYRNPIPSNWKEYSSPYLHYRRLDYVAGHTVDFPNDLVAESIATWNADSGDFYMLKLPQACLERIAFQYISPDKIALASSLLFTPGGAVLSVFSADVEDEEPLMFHHGQHTDPECSVATIWDGMRKAWDHPDDARTLKFNLPHFPCVAATRVLVYRRDFRAERTMIFVLDFDRNLLASLLSKEPSERADWNAQLVEACAQNIHGHNEHRQSGKRTFNTILKEDEDEDEYMDDSGSDGEVLPSGLEYDEAPEEHRKPIPFGYVQTTLYLEGVTDAKQLAITKHAVLELLELPTKNGRVFYFD
ncbi:hypothetical protein C0989_007147 [Termitomyces sp. Mn162]|nr:hypothetical protein C0989_007147 [Termitomyces sp. Mn162]